MIISFVTAQLFRKRSIKFSKIIYGGLFILLFICLMLTGSRGSWFAFFGVDFIFEYLDSQFGGVLFNLGDSNGDYSAILSSFYKRAAG